MALPPWTVYIQRHDGVQLDLVTYVPISLMPTLLQSMPQQDQEALDVAELSNPAALEVPGHWWLVMTHGGKEKAFARECLRSDVPCYLPLSLLRKTCVRRSGGTVKYTEARPLFAGYAFVRTEPRRPNERPNYPDLPPRHLAAVIPIVQQDRLLRELEWTAQAIEENPSLQSIVAKVVGKAYVVTAGPWMGIEGMLIQHLGQERFALSIESCGQMIPLEIDGSLLEPV